MGHRIVMIKTRVTWRDPTVHYHCFPRFKSWSCKIWGPKETIILFETVIKNYGKTFSRQLWRWRRNVFLINSLVGLLCFTSSKYIFQFSISFLQHAFRHLIDHTIWLTYCLLLGFRGRIFYFLSTTIDLSFTPLDRESIASQCMDTHRNPRISKWISAKAWIIEDWYP